MLNASARSRSDHPPCRLLLFLRCYLALREISFSKQAVVEHVIRHPDVMPQNCRQKTKLGIYTEGSEMYELDAVTIIASIIITWGIGLAPPLLIRYAILKRPMDKWPAIGTCAIFWFLNIIIFTALGSKSKTHGALTLVAFVSYWILRKAVKAKESAQ